MESMDDDAKPRFVKASRIELCRPCPTCGTETRHVYHHAEEIGGEETPIYGCVECGERREEHYQDVGAELRPVGQEFKIAYCGVCDAITVHKSHPAGWMCSECKHCFEAVQSALGEHGGAA